MPESGGAKLFLDEGDVVFSRNIDRVLKRPERSADNPVISPEYPWERGGVFFYGSALREDGRFRLWYNAMGEGKREQFTAYAESSDGVHFEKVLMSHKPYRGIEKTNIVFGDPVNTHGPAVVRDMHSGGSERKYWIFFDSYLSLREGLSVPPDIAKRVAPEDKGVEDDWRPPFHRGQFVAESADGFHWSPDQGRLVRIGQSDIGQSVVWDSAARLYRAYIRENEDDRNGRRVRTVHTMTSPDFLNWSESREILRPDPADDPPDTQFYGLAVSCYRGLFIGFLQEFRISEILENGGERGRFKSQLLVSRDGVNFTRVADRTPFLEPGEPGGWEGGMVRVGNSLIAHDDRMWIYYDARNACHAATEADLPLKTGIGAATWPLDRMVALRQKSGASTAEIVVNIPISSIASLAVNAEIESDGEIRYAIYDRRYAPFMGFGMADCRPLRESGLRLPLSWRNDPGIPADENDKALLRIALDRAELFALYI